MEDDFNVSLRQFCQEQRYAGAIVVFQKSDDLGQVVINHNLSYEQCRECLCTGIYYNEQIHIESEVT